MAIIVESLNLEALEAATEATVDLSTADWIGFESHAKAVLLRFLQSRVYGQMFVGIADLRTALNDWENSQPHFLDGRLHLSRIELRASGNEVVLVCLDNNRNCWLVVGRLAVVAAARTHEKGAPE